MPQVVPRYVAKKDNGSVGRAFQRVHRRGVDGGSTSNGVSGERKMEGMGQGTGGPLFEEWHCRSTGDEEVRREGSGSETSFRRIRVAFEEDRGPHKTRIETSGDCERRKTAIGRFHGVGQDKHGRLNADIKGARERGRGVRKTAETREIRG